MTEPVIAAQSPAQAIRGPGRDDPWCSRAGMAGWLARDGVRKTAA